MSESIDEFVDADEIDMRPETPSSALSSKVQSPSLSRRSLIPVPVTRSCRIQSPPEVFADARALPIAAESPSDTYLGITDSTPSFLTFSASLDGVAGEAELEVLEEPFVLDILPTVDDISVGEGRLTGISVTSRSFTGFRNSVNGGSGLFETRQVPTRVDLTRGEKFQALSADPESKNETRHRKHRRLRPSSSPGLSEEQFLRTTETKSSVYYDAVEVQSDISLYRLLEPIQFPAVNKHKMKELMDETRIPTAFSDHWPENDDAGKTFLPLNLKRLSQDLEATLVSAKAQDETLPIKMSRQIELFPTHSGGGLMGSLFIQNKTPHVITFRIQVSTGGRYEVNPTVGQISVGSGSLIFVQTLENQRLTFEDIKQDRFLVDIIPLTGAFDAVHSLLIFWKCGFIGKYRFLVEVREPHLATVLSATETVQRGARVTQERSVLRTPQHSEDIGQLRRLQRQSSSVGQPALEQLLQNSEEEKRYGLICGSTLFGLLLLTCVTFILFH